MVPPLRGHAGSRPLGDVEAAYRVTLEDGTELIASGDHRFLTERGWKHVTGTEQARAAPASHANNALLGIGRFAAAAEASTTTTAAATSAG